MKEIKNPFERKNSITYNWYSGKILAVMQNPEEVINNTLKLIKGFKVLNIPIFYTEQYPKGLGSTSIHLIKELEGLSPIQKNEL